MATAIIMDFAGGTADQYDAVIEKMDLGGKNAEGAVFHVAGPTDDGWRVVDVWEDMDAFHAFAQEKIGPHTQEAGLPEPKLQFVEVAELFDERAGGTGGITHFQVVRAPIDAEAFEEADSDIRDNKQAPPGCMFHVHGPTAEGTLVADGWTSKAARDEFIASKVVPAMQSRGLAPPTIEDLPVHNTLTTA
jgi:quinol monooxygenase YgiN